MSDLSTVGDVVAAFLESCEVTHAFGVTSIHNMPLLDAIWRRKVIRFVAARTEAGAVNMADANARVSDRLGIAVSSTGTAAGNVCGALVEAMTAGTPVLHLTGQIDLPHLDRQKGYLHEAPNQLGMLSSAGKAAFRVWSADTLLGTLREAVRTAFSPPRGPVSVEIPIDVQNTKITMPLNLDPIPVTTFVPELSVVDQLASILAQKRRVMLWLGGGARNAAKPVSRLANLGIGVVTSVQGRGILPEKNESSLGSFNLQPVVEEFYETCDAMLVVGSRLRSNETLSYALKLPQPLYQIDADPRAQSRSYPVGKFVCGDAAKTLDILADQLTGKYEADPTFRDDIKATRLAAEAGMREALGPYSDVLDAVSETVPKDFVWVRDITLSNTIWGNRLPSLHGPRAGVHALGGGIGQGLPMGIGAALAVQDGGRKTLVLSGDGGFAVSLGELATAKQENADITILLMNDGGYGVIRNIADAHYGGRRAYVDILGPDWGMVCGSLSIPYFCIRDIADLLMALRKAINYRGPAVVELDMKQIGDFAKKFAGPPSRGNVKAEGNHS